MPVRALPLNGDGTRGPGPPGAGEERPGRGSDIDRVTRVTRAVDVCNGFDSTFGAIGLLRLASRPRYTKSQTQSCTRAGSTEPAFATTTMTFTCIFCESLLSDLSGAMRRLGEADSKLAFAVKGSEDAGRSELIFEVSVARQEFKRVRSRLENHVFDRHQGSRRAPGGNTKTQSKKTILPRARRVRAG